MEKTLNEIFGVTGKKGGKLSFKESKAGLCRQISALHRHGKAVSAAFVGLALHPFQKVF